MFTRVGRQLAILNAATVILLISIVGAVVYIALRHSHFQELDKALNERVESAELPDDPAAFVRGEDLFANTSRVTDERPPNVEEDYEREWQIIGSGDTVLMVIGSDGRIVGNPREIHLDDVPVAGGIPAALTGDSDVRSVTLNGGYRVRVLTVPVYSGDEVVGAVQGIRSLDELDGRLAELRRVILLGVALGGLIAAPAGFYLSRRAMQPINSAFDRQRQFVADASHELRTPMTLIRANAEMALMEAPEEAQPITPEIKSILREIDHIDRLIGDLLLIARLDSQALDLQTQPSDLSETVAASVDEMRPIFEAAGIRLSFAARSAATASIDQGRIAQVVRILLDNARKHTPAGGSVDVLVENGGETAVVSVSDTGSGIPPEHLHRIFDRFYRVDRSRSRRTGGTGLGLAIARAITEAHGGTIGVVSEPGTGTTASFTLPCRG